MTDRLRNSVALPQHPKAAARLQKAQAFKAKVFRSQRTKPLWQHYAIAVALVLGLAAYAETAGERKSDSIGSYLSLIVAAVVLTAMLSRGIAYLHLGVVSYRCKTDRRKGRVLVVPGKLRKEIASQLEAAGSPQTFSQFIYGHPAESVKLIEAFRDWQRESDAKLAGSAEDAQYLWSYICRTLKQSIASDRDELVARAAQQKSDRAASLRERFPLPPGDDAPASADVPNDASSINLSK